MCGTFRFRFEDGLPSSRIRPSAVPALRSQLRSTKTVVKTSGFFFGGEAHLADDILIRDLALQYVKLFEPLPLSTMASLTRKSQSIHNEAMASLQ